MSAEIIICILVVALSVALLSVKLFLGSKEAVGSQHISDSKAMKERGIGCVLEQDRQMRSENRSAVSERTGNHKDTRTKRNGQILP